MKAGRRWGGLVILVTMLSTLPLVAAAASKSGGSDKAVELPEPLTKDAIRELVSRLSDKEVRDLLLTQLDKVAAPPASKTAGTMAGGLAGKMDRTRTELGAVLRAAPGVPAEVPPAPHSDRPVRGVPGRRPDRRGVGRPLGR
jgi:hypothetical protein